VTTGVLETVGQIAGIGGIAIGVFLVIFKDVIRKNVFRRLGTEHAYRLLRLIIILTWSVALVGIVAWMYPHQVPDIDQQIQRRQQKLLEVDEAIIATHNDFLRLPNTGITKLFPRGKYDHRVSVKGGGAYSFVRRSQDYGLGIDIELSEDMLSVGFAGLDYGFFLPLGDLAVTDLADANTSAPISLPADLKPGWNYMWSYQPPTTEAQARVEHTASRSLDGVALPSKVLAVPNQAFLLRSLSFDRSDVLVGLKVLLRNDDESIIIIWRVLKFFDTPRATNSDPPDKSLGNRVGVAGTAAPVPSMSVVLPTPADVQPVPWFGQSPKWNDRWLCRFESQTGGPCQFFPVANEGGHLELCVSGYGFSPQHDQSDVEFTARPSNLRRPVSIQSPNMGWLLLESVGVRHDALAWSSLERELVLYPGQVALFTVYFQRVLVDATGTLAVGVGIPNTDGTLQRFDWIGDGCALPARQK
jgi:hypothetical protein